MKPLVFVSSVSESYQHIREIARETIQKSGGQSIGFEDFPALDKSSRNACLDGVRDCDVYVGIMGNRYGFESLNGLSPTEEEFNEAVRLGKPKLIFLENVENYEPKQKAFLDRLGDYRRGRFWKKFQTPEDLQEKLEEALREVFRNLMKEFSGSQLKERLLSEVVMNLGNYHDQAWLITASIPTCQALLTDDISFNDEALPRQAFLIGQEGTPSIFEIELSKSKTLKEDHWLLKQTEHQNWREGQRLTIVKLYLDARIMLAMNVTGREPESNNHLLVSFYIYPKMVQEIAKAQLHYISRLCNHFDPHFRWDRIALMTALHNIGNRNFFEPKSGQTSHSIPMRSSERQILAFDNPKILERHQLEQIEYSQVLISNFQRRIK